jgi:uncharacterized delta-60 repeat protein/uncharacterized repeat protein (TIGR01451 family)
MRLSVLPFFIIAAVLAGGPGLVHAKPGDLDASFGAGGKTTTNFLRDFPPDHPNDSVDYGNAVAVQPDGKIIVVGVSSPSIFYSDIQHTFYDFALARYLPDGSLDPEFGTQGRVLTDFNTSPSNNGDDTAKAVVLQTDGKILVGGYSSLREGGIGSLNDFVLARYHPNGTLDTTFGIGGKVRLDLGGHDSLAAVALLNDGKILAAGTAGANIDFTVVRLLSNGTPDTAFGPDHNGIVKTNLGSSPSRDTVHAMVLQPDGKIVVAGTYADGVTPKEDFAVVQYHPDGTLDGSFGGDGIVTTDFGSSFNEEAWAVAVQPDGKIVAAGCLSDDPAGVSCYSGGVNVKFALVRYNASGEPDPSFGTGGKVVTSFGGGDSIAQGVAVDSAGRIVAAGLAGRDFALARYLANGTLDTSFGNNGQVTTDLFTNSYEEIHAIAFQGDGKIVAAGYRGTFDGTYADFAVARYLGDSADLSLAKTDNPDPVSVGAILTYTIEVTNNGPDPANNVMIRDSLPAGVTNISTSSSPAASCGTAFIGPQLQASCSFASLAVGQKATVTIQVKPSSPGVLTNTASVSAVGLFDPVEANNSATITTTVLGVGEAPPEDLEPLPEGEGLPGEEEVSDTVTTGEEGKKDFRAVGGGGLFGCSLDPREIR